MPIPGEYKTAQSRFLAYTEAAGWAFVSREEAKRRYGLDPDMSSAERARNHSLFFDELLDAKVLEFISRFYEADIALRGLFSLLHAYVHDNREFIGQLLKWSQFFDHMQESCVVNSNIYSAPSFAI